MPRSACQICHCGSSLCVSHSACPARITHELRDPSWRDGSLPASVVAWHESLSDRFAPWAEGRVASLRAQQLAKSDISGTEWPP